MVDVKKILREAHYAIQLLPHARRQMLFERLRSKIADDICCIMREQDRSFEVLAKRLKLKTAELRSWIWDRDLKLSELSRILDCLDSEFYPIIRPRKLRRNS
jgi:hypothetical protein